MNFRCSNPVNKFVGDATMQWVTSSSERPPFGNAESEPSLAKVSERKSRFSKLAELVRAICTVCELRMTVRKRARVLPI